MPTILGHAFAIVPPVRITEAHEVPATALEDCLSAVVARDPFVAPMTVNDLLAAEAFVALDDDPEARVLGVGWRRPAAATTLLDLRVRPDGRRHGVGRALFNRIAAGGGPFIVGCDAAHTRALRFLAHRAFKPLGVMLHQRWDGEPDDVPRAFASAKVGPIHPNDAQGLLAAAITETWLPPCVQCLTERTQYARGAWARGRLVGALLAERIEGHDPHWRVKNFAVLPNFQRRGIGRTLLTSLMHEAAVDGLGVCLQVEHEDERTRRWSSNLGFWTYRAWAFHSRDR